MNSVTKLTVRVNTTHVLIACKDVSKSTSQDIFQSNKYMQKNFKLKTYTVRRNILIEQYFLKYGVQCPWAIFDLVEMIQLHVCMSLCFPHPDNLVIKFFISNPDKGTRTTTVSGCLQHTRPKPHTIILHWCTSITHDYRIAENQNQGVILWTSSYT